MANFGTVDTETAASLFAPTSTAATAEYKRFLESIGVDSVASVTLAEGEKPKAVLIRLGVAARELNMKLEYSKNADIPTRTFVFRTLAGARKKAAKPVAA